MPLIDGPIPKELRHATPYRTRVRCHLVSNPAEIVEALVAVNPGKDHNKWSKTVLVDYMGDICEALLPFVEILEVPAKP